MKIISIITPLKFGGGERLTIDLSRCFKSKNLDFVIYNLTKSNEFEYILKNEGLSFVNISTIQLSSTISKKGYLLIFFKLLPLIYKVRKNILKENADAILVNGFPAVFLVPIFLIGFKKPKLIYIHHSLKSKEKGAVRKVYLYFLKKYQKIVGVSSLTAKSLIDSFPEIKDKIICISNGLDCKKYYIKEDKFFIRKRLNLPNGFIGINVGRLAFFKNQNFLIKIAKNISKKDFTFLILGEGEEYKNLKDLISKEKLENKIKLLGYVSPEQIPYYLKACDAFIFPSLKEGFSLAILEAMTAGLPVVIFENIYVEELGHSILVAKDEEEFIEYVQKLMENSALRKKLGEENKKWVQNLDINNMGEKYLSLLQNIDKQN